MRRVELGRYMVRETVDRPDGPSESAESTGRAVAASAVVICGLFLMALPPVVAIVSMFDPDALSNLSRWLERLSPTFTYLDYAKAAMTSLATVLLWRADHHRPGGSSWKRLRQLQIRRRPRSLA